MRQYRMAAIAAAGALWLGLLSAPASATVIHVSNMALSNGYEMVGFTASAGGWAGPTWGGGTEYTGQQNLTFNYGSTYDPSALHNVFAWCVDVFNNINIGANDINYTLGTLSVYNADAIERVAAYGNQLLAVSPGNTPANALISAAIQAEIWILEYGVSLSASTNLGLVQKLADIQAALPGLPTVDGAHLAGFTGGGTAAQGLYTPDLNVPEPASLLLLGSGFVGFGLLRRKRQREPAGA